MFDLAPGLRGAGALLAALVAVAALVPVAISVAERFELRDRPGGWKPHADPTPYLGGAAILAAGAIAVAAFGYGSWPLALVAATAALLALGLVDDARTLHAWPRLVVEVAAGTAVWAADLGWNQFDGELLDLLLTIVWVVSVVNAFNLLDLMDGVATAAVSMSCLGIAALAATQSRYGPMVAALALFGACLGFLYYNLGGPARIFLGDGGTMPIGFLVAVLILSVVRGEPSELALAGATLLFAIPLADAAYRALRRIRAGSSLLTAQRDSIANQLRERLGSERVVCAALAGAQLVAACAALIAIGS